MRRRFAAAALALGCGSAGAAEGAHWYLQLDNDVVASTDRWYTSGLRLARVHRAGDDLHEWGVLQEIYTPEAKHYALGVVDRAPTARLLLVHARHSASQARYRTLELSAGVRGPSAMGEELTDAIHRIVAARQVDWSRQPRDRFDGHVAWTSSDSHGNVRLHYGAVAGTQVAFAHAGLELRFGSGARAVSSPALRYVATPPLAPGGEHGTSGFVAAGGRLVARNRLLDGGYDFFAHDPHRERVVGRFAAGVAWSVPRAAVSFALAVDTREFEGQRRPHVFGSLAFRYDF